MNVNKLLIPTVATMQLHDGDHGPLLDSDGAEMIVKITSYTPDSEQWRQAHRKVYGFQKSNDVKITRNNERVMTVPNDVHSNEKRKKFYASVVTGIDGLESIEGFEDWQYSDDSVLELFMEDGFLWAIDQLDDYLGERKNFLKRPGKTAKDGSDV